MNLLKITHSYMYVLYIMILFIPSGYSSINLVDVGLQHCCLLFAVNCLVFDFFIVF